MAFHCSMHFKHYLAHYKYFLNRVIITRHKVAEIAIVLRDKSEVKTMIVYRNTGIIIIINTKS